MIKNKIQIVLKMAALFLGFTSTVQLVLAKDEIEFVTTKATVTMDTAGQISSSYEGKITYETAGNPGFTNLLGIGTNATVILYVNPFLDAIPAFSSYVYTPPFKITNQFVKIATGLQLGDFKLKVTKASPTKETLTISAPSLPYSFFGSNSLPSLRPGATLDPFTHFKGYTAFTGCTAVIYKGTSNFASTNIISVLNFLSTYTGTFTPAADGSAKIVVTGAYPPL